MMIKRSIQLLLTLFFSLALLIMGLISFIDPNHYKDKIATAIAQQVQLPVTINGNISWQLWPQLGFSIEDIHIGQAKAFEAYQKNTFADIGILRTNICIGPLLKQQIVIDTLSVQKAHIYLVKQANDKTNWNDLVSEKKSNMTIHKASIENSQIIFYDETQSKIINLQLNRLTADLEKNQISIDNLILDNIKIKGELSFTHTHPLAIKFNLHVDNMDVDHYLAVKKQGKKQVIIDRIRQINAQGDLSIDTMTVFGLRLNHTQLHINANQGLVHIAPLKTKLYAGTLNSKTVLDLRKKTPRLDIETTIRRADALPLLKQAAHVTQFTGRLTAHIKATTDGWDHKNLIRHLAGHVTFEIENGALNHLDLAYWPSVGEYIWHGKQILDKFSAPVKAIGQRALIILPYKIFAGSATIAQGIATNNDLMIYHKDYYIGGKGIFDLTTHHLDYVLNISQVKKNDQGVYQPTGIRVPLTATGPINEIKIDTDL